MVYSLSSFSGSALFETWRDCEFEFVGKLPTLLDRRVVFLESADFIEALKASNGVCGVITTESIAANIPERFGVAVSDVPRRAAYTLHNLLFEADREAPNLTQIHPSALIHPTAIVEPYNVVIGARTVVGQNSVVHENTRIGDDVEIANGVTLGARAFEADNSGRQPRLLKERGGILIGDGAVIGSSSVVSKAIFGGHTRIGANSLIDSAVVIGHDVQVGERAIIAANVVLCGRCVIGDETRIAPMAVVSNGIHIGEKAEISMGSVVIGTVAENMKVSGNFAMPHKRYLRHMARAWAGK